jgi:transposase
MRGNDTKQAAMFTSVSPASVVPADHPLRAVKAMTDELLGELSSTFEAMYSKVGRPSIPPERLLKSTILMALYTVRSERMFVEQLGYNLLFKWFLDMNLDEPVFDASTFSKNRARLMEHDIAGQFFRAVVERARAVGLMSVEHFTVDGTLIEAAASLKSFKRKGDDDEPKGDGGSKPGRNAEVNFHGEKRSNDTHESTTDPESRLARKGHMQEAKLYFLGNALMENRNGLLVDVKIAQMSGFAERETALQLCEENIANEHHRCTVAADKGYDTRAFVADLRQMNVTPHVARHTNKRRSAIDARTTRHDGYRISQVIRKRVEEIFGWFKTVGGLRRTRFRGVARTQLAAYLVGAAYNLLRVTRLSTG